jgi:hypothetical protein
MFRVLRADWTVAGEPGDTLVCVLETRCRAVNLSGGLLLFCRWYKTAGISTANES